MANKVKNFWSKPKNILTKKAIKKQVDELAKVKSPAPTLGKWVDEIKDVSLLKKIESLNADDLAKLEKDFLSKSNGNELKKLITTADDLDKWKLLKEDPHYAFELAQENPNWEKWAKSNFFKEVTKKGKDFELLVTSKIRNIPPFSTLYKEYTHLKQIYLKGVKDNIIADDLFVKEFRDERGRSYFRAVISDSKLNTGSPWTANQKKRTDRCF
ncbi:hypothetical protein QIU18_02875 [Capnocytophaga canimorsus]|nr:hypothetical protein [Capnocytophaga canimorsus]WGU70985.1 hypothetical protein QIU18_02875 [Capnocytophaga canimorsus]